MPLTAEQMESRRTGLGGSDAAAILGLSPYAGPIDVFARFHPEVVEPLAREDTLAMRMGSRLEAPIADEYAERSGLRLVAPAETFRHPKRPWMLAHPDRLVDGRGGPRIIEIKTASLRLQHLWGEDGTEDIPEGYRAQVAHYQAVLGIDIADVVVLIGGQELRVYQIRRDPDLEELLLGAEQEFWTLYVETGVCPPVAGPTAADWAKKLWPRNLRPLREASPEEIDLALAYDRARAAAKVADEEKETAAAALKGAIGDAEGLRWGRSTATWKCNKDGAKTDWETLARTFDPPASLIAQHTRNTNGARVLNVRVKE